MLAEMLDRGEGHSVHRVGTDQFLDVQYIPVGRIFRACAGPQWPLDTRPPLLESSKARPAEQAFELLIGQAGIGDGDGALQGFELLPLNADANSFHPVDRKSTRLNSSHVKISYAVFCLKK